MYYITNQDNQIIAADRDFLKLLGLNTISELSIKIAEEKIHTTDLGNSIEIVNNFKTITLQQDKTTMMSLLGNVTLVEVTQLERSVEPKEKKQSFSILGDSIDSNTPEIKKSINSGYSILFDDSANDDTTEQAEAEARRIAQEQAQAEARRIAEEQAQAEARRIAQEKAQAEARRIAEEQAEAEARRIAQEKAEAEAQRIAQEKAQAEAQRIAQEKAEAEAQRIAQEKAQAEARRIAQEQAEAEARRIAEEQAQAEARRIAQEKAQAEAQRIAQEKAQAEAQRIAQEKAEAEARRIAQEQAQAEAQRIAQEQAQAEARRIAEEQAQAEAQRIAQEQAQAEARRIAQEKAEAEARRIAQEQAEAEARRIAQEQAQAEAQRIAQEKADAEAKLAEESDVMDFLLDDNDFLQSDEKIDEKAQETQSDTEVALVLDDDTDFLKSSDEINQPIIETTPEKDSLDFDLDDDFLQSETTTPKATVDEITLPEKDSLDFDLDDDFLQSETTTPKATVDEITLPEKDSLDFDLDDDFLGETAKVENTQEDSLELNLDDNLPEEYTPIKAEEISLDLKTLSANLGISEDDYSEFLHEFADKASEVESSIKAGGEEQEKAISSLVHLTQMLQLTQISNLLEEIQKLSEEHEKDAINTFYEVVSKLTTPAPEKEEVVSKESAIELQVDEPQAEESVPPVETVQEDVSANKICDLSFEGIKPIHFDFQMEKAAEDLSLPVDLIEEFVGDFIVQANEEKQTFIDACKIGDVDTIQKTGHKLKGVASNLRIIPLADTLEEVQFCEDKSRFEPLLKKYWGQFIAFEVFMNSVLKNQGEK